MDDTGMDTPDRRRLDSGQLALQRAEELGRNCAFSISALSVGVIAAIRSTGNRESARSGNLGKRMVQHAGSGDDFLGSAPAKRHSGGSNVGCRNPMDGSVPKSGKSFCPGNIAQPNDIRADMRDFTCLSPRDARRFQLFSGFACFAE